jgi:hypothetical protein
MLDRLTLYQRLSMVYGHLESRYDRYTQLASQVTPLVPSHIIRHTCRVRPGHSSTIVSLYQPTSSHIIDTATHLHPHCP